MPALNTVSIIDSIRRLWAAQPPNSDPQAFMAQACLAMNAALLPDLRRRWQLLAFLGSEEV